MHTEPQPHDSRQDVTAAQLVDEGIAMSEQFGRRKAASFMEARGVRFTVIVRVLDRQARRRVKVPQ